MTEPEHIAAGQLLRELQFATDEFNRLTSLAHTLGLEVVAELIPISGATHPSLRPVLAVKLYTGCGERL